MLAEMKKRSRGLPLAGKEADILNLRVTHGLCDVAVSRWALPHFANWDEILLSVSRILRPGAVSVCDIKKGEHVDLALAMKRKPFEPEKADLGKSVSLLADPYSGQPLEHSHTASEDEIK